MYQVSNTILRLSLALGAALRQPAAALRRSSGGDASSHETSVRHKRPTAAVGRRDPVSAQLYLVLVKVPRGTVRLLNSCGDSHILNQWVKLSRVSPLGLFCTSKSIHFVSKLFLSFCERCDKDRIVSPCGTNHYGIEHEGFKINLYIQAQNIAEFKSIIEPGNSNPTPTKSERCSPRVLSRVQG